MHILDRVFHRDDVAGRIGVAVVDHRRQRRRLARAGAADHQHQAALGHDDVLEHFGQVELMEIRDLGGDGAYTIATFCCCTKTLTRKRHTSGSEMAKLHSISASNSRRCLSFMMDRASARVISPDSFCWLSGFIAPCDLMLGGKSAEMNRSEPPVWCITLSSLWR